MYFAFNIAFFFFVAWARLLQPLLTVTPFHIETSCGNETVETVLVYFFSVYFEHVAFIFFLKNMTTKLINNKLSYLLIV